MLVTFDLLPIYRNIGILLVKSSRCNMNNHSSTDYPDTQALLHQIIIEHFQEKKRQRVWGVIKLVSVFALLLVAVCLFFSLRHQTTNARMTPHVGLLDVQGAIGSEQPGGAESFINGIGRAYKNKGLKALIIRIDSPGGSPVQADYIYQTIRYYRQKFPKIKTYAVCVDTCASAAYYIAAAADEIYANPSSLVGSIGVIYNGFGFVDAMQKLGVTRRLQTAGRSKGFLDQFSPVNPAQEQSLQVMLDVIHRNFIARVKEGRGARLKIDEDTFSGLIWTGVQAKERGLIDGFASSEQLLHETLKMKDMVDYTDKRSVFEQVAKRIGTTMVDQLPLALGLKQGVQ